jgi:hypothetical protein
MLDTHITIAASKAKNIGDDNISKRGADSERLSLRSVPRSLTGFLPPGHPSGLRTSPWLTRESCKSDDEARMLSRGV